MKPRGYWTPHSIQSALAVEPSSIHQLSPNSFAATIHDSRYESANIPELCAAQTQLTSEQQAQLESLLSKYTKLF
jgi:hypothetical protein